MKEVEDRKERLEGKKEKQSPLIPNNCNIVSIDQFAESHLFAEEVYYMNNLSDDHRGHRAPHRRSTARIWQ
jgi:hypothetical protein